MADGKDAPNLASIYSFTLKKLKRFLILSPFLRVSTSIHTHFTTQLTNSEIKLENKSEVSFLAYFGTSGIKYSFYRFCE